jgi:hypothetical protein
MDWIEERDILDTQIRRFSHAYPVLEIGYAGKTAQLNAYLSRFENFRSEGRNAKFAYSWIHDMMRGGYEIAAGLRQLEAKPRPEPVSSTDDRVFS